MVEEGLWTVLITIEDAIATYGPREMLNLRVMTETLLRQINNGLNISDTISRSTRRAWNQRLQIISQDPRITANSQFNRRKRGILDIGGILLNKIFGTATEGQVKELREQLQRASLEGRTITHTVNQLITIVNTTRMAERQTRSKLNELIIEVAGMHHAQYNYWHELREIEQMTAIGEMISMLESVFSALMRELQLERNIQQSLEAGRLTEELFPVPLLDQISSEARIKTLHPLRSSWYYEHVAVRPLLMNGATLVYRIQLPYIGADSYLCYHLHSWPVPITNSTSAVKLTIRQEIAFHTTLGYVFTPQNCQGRDPQVCRTGPLILDSTSSCERGLVTGHAEDRSNCKVNFVEMPRTKIYERNRGHYILQTRGEAYALACRGQRQIKSSVDAGTFEVVLPGGCTMSGQGWLLKGERLQFVNVSGTINRINITLFPMPLEKPTMLPYSRDVDALGDIPDMTLKPIKMNDNDILYQWDEVAHHLSWINIICFIGIIIMTAMAVRYFYQRRKGIAFYLGSWAKKKKEVKSDQLPLASETPATSTMELEQIEKK